MINRTTALFSASTLAAGIIAGSLVGRDDGASNPADVNVDIVRPDMSVDTDAYNERMRNVRQNDQSAADLMSAPVGPSEDAVAGANFPHGSKLVGDVHVDDSGSWVILKTQCTDRESSTWCEVRARNSGAGFRRLVAIVHYKVVTP